MNRMRMWPTPRASMKETGGYARKNGRRHSDLEDDAVMWSEVYEDYIEAQKIREIEAFMAAILAGSKTRV